MILRRFASPLLSLLALPILLSLSGCSSLKVISILPGAGTEVLTSVGQTAQYSAFGQSQMGSGQPTTANITTSVAWSVTNPSVATINPATGLATAVANGFTQIVAQSDGIVATSDLTVEISASGSGSGGNSTAITITPASATETFIGETTQFLANGSLTGGASQNLTSVVQWISSNVQVATVSSTGLATATGGGNTTITAQSGGISASVTLTVAVSGTSGTPTLTLIPTGGTATFGGETTQFIALGSLNGSAITSNLTSNVVWSSSDVAVATIDQSGLAVAVGANSGIAEATTITAIGTTSTGSLISATATLTVQPGVGTVNLPALAVYLTGTSTGTVNSSPGTISCGTATGSCTGTYALGTVVILTATPATGAIFGGWSSNCTLVAGNPLQCSIKMTNNETVGAIFNP